jgi:hypothetical protein
MVAWDYEVRAQEYDPVADAWSAAVDMPMDFSECYPESVATRNVVFAWFCGQASTYEAETGAWRRLHGGVLEPTIVANDQEYALFRFVSMIAADDVVVVVAEGITIGEDDVPCYGCPGAPLSAWVFRPGP